MQSKKVLTQVTMKKHEYQWREKYLSTVYKYAFQDLKDAFNWDSQLVFSFKTYSKSGQILLMKVADIIFFC